MTTCFCCRKRELCRACDLPWQRAGWPDTRPPPSKGGWRQDRT
ncbi:hypothetical protein [Nonomuraea basaltis]|nr:hypothetical protein [Nonomuraea basaltis]